MSKLSLWLQVVVGFGLLECALWTEHRVQLTFSFIALGWVLGCVFLWRRQEIKDLGISATGLRGSLRAVPIAFAGAIIMLLLARFFGTLDPIYGSRPWAHSLGYFIWSILQQFMLNSFFFLAFERLFGNSRKAWLMTVLLFAIAHIPNPALTLATLVGAMFFVEMFRRYRNIYPLAVAHALLGLTISITVPTPWMRHMRVGIGYLRFNQRPVAAQTSAPGLPVRR